MTDLLNPSELEAALDLGNLDLTSRDEMINELTNRDGIILDIVNGHIRENLEDELVQEALKTGVDLRHYSQEIEKELAAVEAASITDYIGESKKIAQLHKEMKQCDSILEQMEQMLGTFQQDLGSISTEIQTLQEKSLEMSVKLGNRKELKTKLSTFLDNIVVSPKLVETIVNTSVVEPPFMDALHELDQKLQFAEAEQHTLASNDVSDVLDKLKTKAVIKIRLYILEKVQEYKKPMSNYQVLQETLLKFKYYYEFLVTHSPSTAAEIKLEYVDTVSKVYFSYFKTYQSRLIRLEFEEVPTKADVMGAEDESRRSIQLSMFSSSKTIRSRSTVFTLGNRDELINNQLEWPVIIPVHSADKKFPYEAIFRSVQFSLIDNVCAEYGFLVHFFKVRGEKAQILFTYVMERTLSLLIKSVESYMEKCYDCIGIMLCAHITMHYHELMKKRGFGALVGFHNQLLQILWPRFTFVLSQNIHSIRETDPGRLTELDTRPHFITRRFGEFYSAIHTLNDKFPNDQTVRSMSLLQVEVENVVLRMAAEFRGRQDQLVFLINNYDLMLSVMQCRSTDTNKEVLSIQELLNKRINEYVDEVLLPHFGGMISFVKDNEKMLESAGPGSPKIKVNEGYINQLVRGFNQDHKKSIDSINSDVMRRFTNFNNGTVILQSALTKMIQYYSRFHKILSQPPFKTLPCRMDMINVHHVMVEVKKYKNQF